MTWCRRAALLLLPLLVLVSIPERPTSAVQTTAAVRFPPPDVGERNDIVLDNRVPIRMRDGVSLYADVFRPVGNERYPVIVSRTPYSTERAYRLIRAARHTARALDPSALRRETHG